MDINEKIGIKEKICFAFANMGNIPVTALVNSFLLIFYTNVVGLDPGACATLFLIARILDGVNDPIVGFLVDHFPNTKHGHFRVTLIIGSALCSLNYLLLWFGPMMVTSFKLGIAYISYLLLGILFPVMDISLNSLLPVMTYDAKERDKLSSLKGTIYLLGSLAVGVIGPLVIGDTAVSGGYVLLVAGAALIIFLFSFIGALGVKERVKAAPGQSYSIKDLYHIILKRPVFVTFLASLLYTTGSYVSSTVSSYNYTYIIGNFTMMSAISMVTVVAMFPGIILSGVLTKKIGKKYTYAIGLLACMCIPMLRLINVVSIPILVVTSALASCGAGIIVPQLYSIQADNTDYIELETGKRAEGAIASLSSFVTKCGMGLGGALPGYILAAAGFQKDAAVQTEGVKMAIITCCTWIPFVLAIIAVILFLTMYPLTKEKLKEQNQKIAEIRKQSNKGL